MQGVPDHVEVHVPSTALLTLRHIVDAIDAWGEADVDRRTEDDINVLDTVRARVRACVCVPKPTPTLRPISTDIHTWQT